MPSPLHFPWIRRRRPLPPVPCMSTATDSSGARVTVSFEAEGTAARLADDGHPKGHLQLAVRVASHASVWLLILSSCIGAIARGWLPVGDDAAILRPCIPVAFYPSTAGRNALDRR